MYDGATIAKENRTASLYHVRKLSDTEFGDYSQVFLFDVDKTEFDFASQKSFLDSDLGQSYLRAKYSKELKDQEQKFLQDQQRMQTEIATLQITIKQKAKPILYIEDSYDQLIKVAWLKLYSSDTIKRNNIENLFEKNAPFAILKAEGAAQLAGFLRTKNVDGFIDRKIVGLFDFDIEGVYQFKNLKNQTYWKEAAIGKKTTGIYKKRSGHPHFFALLLPIPDRLETLADLNYPSLIEIENLLPETFLIQHSLASEQVTTGATRFLKIKDDKKEKTWQKSIQLPQIGFNDFRPLFHILSQLLNITP